MEDVKKSFPTAAALGGGTNLIGSIINTVAARKAQERENQFNKQMAEYAYNKELEMWNRQNEYNTPLAQMARFKEAGLNPNLIYGKGTPGNATVMPKYNAPNLKEKARLPDLTGVLGSYQDAKLKQAQIDVTTNQARLLDEKVTTESVNRAAKQYNYQYYLPTRLGREGRMMDKRAAAMNQQWNMNSIRMAGMRQANIMSRYNTQIAEQNLMLRIKDNQSYWWRNVGSGVVKGASNLFKIGKGSLRLKGAKVPSKLTPKKSGGYAQYLRNQHKGARFYNGDILPNYNF